MSDKPQAAFDARAGNWREAFDPRSRRFSRRRTKERADGVEPDVAAPTSLMDAAAQNPRTGTPTLQDPE